jgi:poly-gamma-glutamate synthesis protein (capsule biosynthesis protein)
VKFALFGVNLVVDESLAENNKSIYQPLVQSLIKNITEYHNSNSENVIIINIHWGFEYREFPTSAQRTLAHNLIDAGATIIAGHHSHTVQPIEFYKDGVIIYSLGNLIFDQSSPVTRRSMVVSVDFKSKRIHAIKIFPLMIDSYIPRQCSRSDWGELDIIGSNDRINWEFVK